jgi:hypothetical protein
MKFYPDLIFLVSQPEWTADQLVLVEGGAFEANVAAKFLEKNRRKIELIEWLRF